MSQKVNLVVFDFDGTLSSHDCNVQFGKYCFAHSLRPWLFIPFVMVAGVGKFLNPGGIWWRETMRRFLTDKMVKDLSPAFIKEHKQNRFGWAKEQVEAERAAGNKVILISAGPDYLIPHMVKDIKFDAVICSQMDSKKPWKYNFLCWGENKVVAMDIWAYKNKFTPKLIKSYSDSKTDLPLMNLACEQVWIDPKTGMRKNKYNA